MVVDVVRDVTLIPPSCEHLDQYAAALASGWSPNNLRDVTSDRASNKKTLVVRFGETFGRIEITACVVLPLVLIFFITWTPLASFPLVVFLIRTVWHAHGAHLNRCLAVAGLLQWTFGVLFVVGIVL